MSIRPYTGPAVFLSGGRFESVGGTLTVTPVTKCQGGQCPAAAASAAPPTKRHGTPAPATKASHHEPEPDLDPSKIYAARATPDPAAASRTDITGALFGLDPDSVYASRAAASCNHGQAINQPDEANILTPGGNAAVYSQRARSTS